MEVQYFVTADEEQTYHSVKVTKQEGEHYTNVLTLRIPKEQLQEVAKLC